MYLVTVRELKILKINSILAITIILSGSYCLAQTPIKVKVSPSLKADQLLNTATKEYDTKNYEKAFPIFDKLAKSGNVIAQHYIGKMYLLAQGTTEDRLLGIDLLKKAAEKNHADSEALLGACYLQGTGVLVDHTESAKWIHRAAEHGHITSMYLLGLYYAAGTGVTKSEDQQFYWIKKAADLGNSGAQYKLGDMYSKTWGNKFKSPPESVKWYRKAGIQGDFKAIAALYYCYKRGEGVMINSEIAYSLFRFLIDRKHLSNDLAQTINIVGNGYKKDMSIDEINEAEAFYNKIKPLGLIEYIKLLPKSSAEESTENNSSSMQ